MIATLTFPINEEQSCTTYAPQAGCDEPVAWLGLRRARALGGLGPAITTSENSRANSFAALCRNAEDPELLFPKEEQLLLVLDAFLRGRTAAAASSKRVRAIQRPAGSQRAAIRVDLCDEADADWCARVADVVATLLHWRSAASTEEARESAQTSLCGEGSCPDSQASEACDGRSTGRTGAPGSGHKAAVDEHGGELRWIRAWKASCASMPASLELCVVAVTTEVGPW